MLLLAVLVGMKSLSRVLFLSSLVQSGYFSSMFSGSWKESSMNVIELEIPDQNIDVEGEWEPFILTKP